MFNAMTSNEYGATLAVHVDCHRNVSSVESRIVDKVHPFGNFGARDG